MKAAVAAGCDEVRAGSGHVASIASQAQWRVRAVPIEVSEESELCVS